MVCIQVLAPSGNISHRNLVTVACLKLLLTPTSLLVKKVISICSVDDLIFWAKNEKDIVVLSVQLHTEGVDLECASLLGKRSL